MADTHRIGVIADTHGVLRDDAVAALAGVERIIHAGDVGKKGVLERLRAVAPVHAIRGNIDRAQWAQTLPTTDAVEVGGQWLYIVHDLNDLDIDPVQGGFQAVISGHTHRPSAETRRGVLFLNPGSAGPRRFKLPVTLAILEVGEAGLEPTLIELEPPR